MVFLNQILCKYYENLGICYILYYLDIHPKKLKSIQPVLLNPGAPLLFVARSIESDIDKFPSCCFEEPEPIITEDGQRMDKKNNTLIGS